MFHWRNGDNLVGCMADNDVYVCHDVDKTLQTDGSDQEDDHY